MTAISLSPTQGDQLLALLERGATSKGEARHIDELTFGSRNVLLILERMHLVEAVAKNAIFAKWRLTRTGEEIARDILRDRTHG